MKKLVSVFLCIIVLTCSFGAVFGIFVSAKSCDISVSSSSVKVGDTFEVTVICSPKTEIFSATSTLTFNDSLVSYISGATKTTGTSAIIEDSNPGKKVRSYIVKFRAIAEGSLNFLLKTVAIRPDSLKGSDTATASLNIKKNDSPDISKVKSISVSNGKLLPSFINAITEYSVEVPYDISTITIDATTSDKDTTIKGIGEQRLSVGENKKTITATENGNEVNYNITIKRLSKEETKELEEQKLENLNVLIDNTVYTIKQDLSDVEIPEGYSVTKTNYLDLDVDVATDAKGRYKLFYLTNHTETVSDWYYLDDTDTFSKLNYIISNNTFYIVESSSILNQNGNAWYPIELRLKETDTNKIKAYKSTDSRLKNIYVINCYANGKNDYYRYDEINKTVQIAPDFISVSKAKPVNIHDKNIVEKFTHLPNSGKVVLTLALIEVITFIIIIAILVIRVFKNRAKPPLENLDKEEDEDLEILE